MGICIKGIDMPGKDEMISLIIRADGVVYKTYDVKCKQIGSAEGFAEKKDEEAEDGER